MMIDNDVNGIQDEGRVLCLTCANRIFGNSLEMYLDAGAIQMFTETDRPTYTCKGLLCDECYRWIFQPDPPQDPWWRVDPDPEEHQRLLAPFADFLETLQIDAINLRHISNSLAENPLDRRSVFPKK